MLDRLVARAATVVTHTEPPVVFAEVGRHPRLFRWWLPFAGSLMFRGYLPRADTELVVLRTAWNCRSRYEWVHHVRLAERAGLTSAQIAAAAEGPAANALSVRQRLLVQATDDLHAGRAVLRPTWIRLAGLLTERQRVELCMLVGHYEMLAMVLKSRGIQPEPTAVAQLSGAAAALDLRLAHAEP